MEAVLQARYTQGTEKLKRMSGKVLPIFAGLRRLQGAIEMQFSESTPRPLQICLSETVRLNGWLILILPGVIYNNMPNSASHNNSRQKIDKIIR